MARPTLDYERAAMPVLSREERLRRFNRRMFRAIAIHVIASYVTSALLMVVMTARGSPPARDDVRKMLLAPLTLIVIVPLSIIIVLFPVEGSAQPLVFVTMPYLITLVLTAWIARRHWPASALATTDKRQEA